MMDKLSRETTMCLSLLQKKSVRIEYNEIFSELFILHMQARNTYDKTGNHGAKFNTYFDTCVKNWSLEKIKRQQMETFLFVELRAENEATDSDNDPFVGVIIAQIKEQLKAEEEIVFNKMLFDKSDNRSISEAANLTYRQVVNLKETIKNKAAVIMEAK